MRLFLFKRNRRLFGAHFFGHSSMTLVLTAAWGSAMNMDERGEWLDRNVWKGKPMSNRMLRFAWRAGILVAVGVGTWNYPLPAQNPFISPSATKANEVLNEGSTGAATGKVVLEKAKTVAVPPGQIIPGVPAPNAAVGGKTATAAVGQATQAVARVTRRRTAAIVGTRVFDACSGEMLDDGRSMLYDESEKGNTIFDDGDTMKDGDLVANDGQFTNVVTDRSYIGQSNQRLKERLIKAIYSAEQLSPLDFYGFFLMTTERNNPAPRNRRWTMVANPKGIGQKLTEVPTDKPVPVPKYREWEHERDQKIAGKEGWAVRFLDEYRKEKGSVESEFYTVYIPMPPVPPFMPPPTSAGWTPFPNPAGKGPDQGPGGSAMGAYGYKVKTNPATGELPTMGGAASKPYYDTGKVTKGFR